MCSPKIIPENKLPFAHQVWTISISPRVLQVCNFTTNQDAGRNSLMLPAPAEDASFTVHSTVQKVLSFGWPSLQCMQDSVSVSAAGLALHGASCACLCAVCGHLPCKYQALGQKNVWAGGRGQLGSYSGDCSSRAVYKAGRPCLMCVITTAHH